MTASSRSLHCFRWLVGLGCLFIWMAAGDAASAKSSDNGNAEAGKSLETQTPLDGLSPKDAMVFTRSTDVTLYRIEARALGASGDQAPSTLQEVWPGTTTLDTSRPGPRTVARLRRLLMAPSSYVPADNPLRKRCVFEPGILIRFRYKGDKVDLVLCLVCDQLEIPGAGTVDVDPGRPALVKLMKKLFPRDKAVRRLSPKRKDWGWWRRGLR